MAIELRVFPYHDQTANQATDLSYLRFVKIRLAIATEIGLFGQVLVFYDQIGINNEVIPPMGDENVVLVIL